jgi:hypothetical protein
MGTSVGKVTERDAIGAMDIEELVWLPGNVAKLAAHCIARWEVLSVLDTDDWVVYVNDD